MKRDGEADLGRKMKAKHEECCVYGSKLKVPTETS